MKKRVGNAHRKLTPGEAGTKKYVKMYGEILVCVRYKYDIIRKEKLKTVELIVEREPWEPSGIRIPPNKIMNIRVAVDEYELRSKVKSLGGRWEPRDKVWKLDYKSIKILGLQKRIVKEADDE